MPRKPKPRPRSTRHPAASLRAKLAPQARPRAARTPADTLELLRRLSEASGVSGAEGAVRQIVLEQLRPTVPELRVDALGNVLVRCPSSGRHGPRVLLAAHMDEVGLMVVGADSEGMLKFERVGGLEETYLAGKPVWIGTDRLPGVIGSKPIHLTEADELRTPLKSRSLVIDIGATSKEEALKRVNLGDRVVFATPFEHLGATLRGKALDDRLGVAALIELVSAPPRGVELVAAFTTQEEIGTRGAQVAAHALEPQLAIVLDCTPAHDLPAWDGSENTVYNTRLGAGPAIYLADGGTVSDQRLVRLLVQAAEAERLPYQFRQPGGGATDAAAIHLSRAGVPSISLSIPGRYLHTPVSLARLEDWRNAVALVRAALTRLRPDVIR